MLCWFCSRIQVRLGEHNIEELEGGEEFIDSEKVIQHPNYNSWLLDNDIMLIKLKNPVQFSAQIAPIPLPTACAPAGTDCLISGWGNTLSNGGECQYDFYLFILFQKIIGTGKEEVIT